MKKQDPWFFDERAFSFASLLLSKPGEVIVQAYAGRDTAIDLLVELRRGKSLLGTFGVQVIPYMDLPRNPEERVLSHTRRNSFEADLPLCVFVIGVRKPEGVYRWTVEPVIRKGKPILEPKRKDETSWQPLDEVRAASLIDQVKAWYDARSGSSRAKMRGREAKAEAK